MRIHNVTVCDQVRVENNGKFLLIGVYTNTILLAQFPSHFGLNIWLLVEPDAVGTRPFSFRAKMQKSGAQIFEIDGGIEVTTVDEWIPMAFGAETLLNEPDDIVIEGRFGPDEEWTTLRTMHVRPLPMLDSPPQNIGK
jgi:hypothetical protein